MATYPPPAFFTPIFSSNEFNSTTTTGNALTPLSPSPQGTYTTPSSVVVNSYGQVTSATGGTTYTLPSPAPTAGTYTNPSPLVINSAGQITSVTSRPNISQILTTSLATLTFTAGSQSSQLFTATTSIPNAGIWLVIGNMTTQGGSAETMTWNGFQWSGFNNLVNINFGGNFSSALSAPSTYAAQMTSSVSSILNLSTSLTYPISVSYSASVRNPSINIVCFGSIQYIQIA